MKRGYHHFLFYLVVPFVTVALLRADIGMKGTGQGFFFFWDAPLIAYNVEAMVFFSRFFKCGER